MLVPKGVAGGNLPDPTSFAPAADLNTGLSPVRFQADIKLGCFSYCICGLLTRREKQRPLCFQSGPALVKPNE